MRDTPETAKQIKALAMALARLEQELPGLITSAEHAQLLEPQYLRDRLRMIVEVGQQALSQLKVQSIDEVKRQLTAMAPMLAATAMSRIQGIEEWLRLVAERGQEAWEIVAPALRQEGHEQPADQLAFAGRTVRMYALEADNARQRLEKESRSRQDIRGLIRRHVYDFNMQPGNAYRYRRVEDIAEDLGLALDTVGHEVVYLVGTDDLKVHNHPIGTAYPRISITPKGQDVIDTPPLLLAEGQETPQMERAQDIMDHQPDYDVAISFAGEDRPYAKTMAEELKRRHVNVFYDEDEKAQLWGKNLYTHLIDVYQHKARYCIMFLSQHYARKLWTNHERQAAQARAFNESQEYILPIRLDDTDIPGILPTTGYLNWAAETPESIADAILAKLGLAFPSPADGSTTVTAELLDPALARLLAPDDAPWAHIQRQIFAYRNVYDLSSFR